VSDLWPTRTLAEVCGGKGSYGLTASGNADPVGPKFLRTTDMIDGSIDWSAVPYCEVDDATAKKNDVRHGDLVISRTGANAGATAYVSHPPEGAVFAGYLVRFRADPNLADARFLGFALKSEMWRAYVQSARTGSAQPQLNAVLMGQFSFPLPPLDEQRRIAGVLGALDDLIEVNRGLIGNLEALAHAKFRQTVDELGDGVEACSLASTVEVLSGGTPRTSDATFWDGEIPWFSVADAPSNSQSWVLSTEKTITEEGLSGSAAKLVPIGATVLTARGTVGKTALVGQPMAINQSCYALVCRAGGQGYFNLFRVRSAVESLQRMSHGSVFSTITRGTLDSVQVPAVPAHLILSFDAQVDPIFQQMRALVEENNDLALVRDELLPLLMSGRIRVGENSAA
jgi:type I restriction enzyme S subunit